MIAPRVCTRASLHVDARAAGPTFFLYGTSLPIRQLPEFTLQVAQRLLEDVPVTGIAGRFQILQHSRPGKKQALLLPEPIDLCGIPAIAARISSYDLGGIDL